MVQVTATISTSTLERAMKKIGKKTHGDMKATPALDAKHEKAESFKERVKEYGMKKAVASMKKNSMKKKKK